ncbi:bifunctional hydroxymethylpyrimidine kinase/phosphomethylpyrimidine kinase [Actibacterium lipolyticum]|uniref:hydroxymethylpyrimidine kinase n=1 Tax=Actibacterium lipolyticum TaxID=1524263 RepID=A0A238L816_9RHOB|nr:bifunctional hydroxymethylpyrimidine kinase/phosphomethylpyrimidine kinase [Actibacterium lipolyticum]SMX51235.1 Hydroxymethylpyrimidine/phosphomethylpyrimidine kinase [Actibacterium lipolyticum]
MVSIALTIAGSDSGGGAGIQADLKAFSALGVYGCSVITAVTAQNTRDVTAVHPIPTDVIAAQIDAVLSDIDVAAIKIGMLGMPDVIETVAEALQSFDGPIVLDPVMIAKSGAALLPQEATAALREVLLPRATVLTPNIPEAARLLDADEQLTDEGLKQQGRALFACGPQAVLMKGGHGAGGTCTDWLMTADSEQSLQSERIDTKNTHGTGCSYSSGIAAGLAKGQSVAAATHAAHGWLHDAIRRADQLNVGSGHGPVHHFHGLWA